MALRQDKKYSCNKIATAQIQISCFRIADQRINQKAEFEIRMVFFE